MKQLTSKKMLILPAVLVLIIAVSLLAFLAITTQANHKQTVQTQGSTQVQTQGGVTSDFLISRNVPAYASSGYTPPYRANDSDYNTMWRSQGTHAWLAYNLSSVPASQRGKVLVVWYNETFDYDHTITRTLAYNMPEDYTIDVNPASGQGDPPDSGWVTLVSVKGNHYHSRQHIIDMTGNNWIRINVTAVDGALENFDTAINMDVYNASSGIPGDWIFYGDSITASGMGHLTMGGVKTFAQLINAGSPNNFPVQEAGGTGYLTSDDGAKYINTWLSLFPGRYVGLSYGTNDALGCVSGNNFYDAYATMVQAVLTAGKVPVVPHIPWGRAANIQKCATQLNTQIDALYKAFPQIIKGPDLWTFFQKNQNLISNDDIHPTDTGFGAYRQQWANTMLTAVYHR